jgi:hypothetical protein
MVASAVVLERNLSVTLEPRLALAAERPYDDPDEDDYKDDEIDHLVH